MTYERSLHRNLGNGARLCRCRSNAVSVARTRRLFSALIAEVKQVGLVIEVYARDIASFIGAPLR
jgi:hypothetical protein